MVVVRRLQFVLAWSECIRASWNLAAGELGWAAAALAAAGKLLDGSGRSRGSSAGWRPIVAPKHGMTVAATRRG